MRKLYFFFFSEKVIEALERVFVLHSSHTLGFMPCPGCLLRVWTLSSHPAYCHLGISIPSAPSRPLHLSLSGTSFTCFSRIMATRRWFLILRMNYLSTHAAQRGCQRWVDVYLWGCWRAIHERPPDLLSWEGQLFPWSLMWPRNSALSYARHCSTSLPTGCCNSAP